MSNGQGKARGSRVDRYLCVLRTANIHMYIYIRTVYPKIHHTYFALGGMDGLAWLSSVYVDETWQSVEGSRDCSWGGEGEERRERRGEDVRGCGHSGVIQGVGPFLYILRSVCHRDKKLQWISSIVARSYMSLTHITCMCVSRLLHRGHRHQG